MSYLPFGRGDLTKLIVSNLTAQLATYALSVVPGVGQEIAPQNPQSGSTLYGWNGQPGQGQFMPYCVVKTKAARPRRQADDLSVLDSSWTAQYHVSNSGGVPQEAEWVADNVRIAMTNLPRGNTPLGANLWHVQFVHIIQYGEVVPDQATDPPFYNITDVYEVWLDYVRGQ